MTNEFVKGYTDFIPEIWSQKLINLLSKKCVMSQCVNRNYEGEIKNSGDKVKIISPGSVTVSTLLSTDITYTEASSSSQTLNINQHKYFAFKINDVSVAQANSSIMDAHINVAKKAIEEAQDSFLLGFHTEVEPENIITSTGSAPVALDSSTVYSYFVKLAKALKKSDAITDNQKPWVIINPDVEEYLLKCSQFTSAYQLGDNTLREGSIGRIAGLDVLVSTNLTSTAGKIYVLAGTNDAITFASQVAKIESIRDKDSFSDLVRGLYVYGAKVVQPNALAKIIFNTP